MEKSQSRFARAKERVTLLAARLFGAGMGFV
jgi:hypothetical protein